MELRALLTRFHNIFISALLNISMKIYRERSAKIDSRRFGDSRRIRRQSPVLVTVAVFGDKLFPKSATRPIGL